MLVHFYKGGNMRALRSSASLAGNGSKDAGLWTLPGALQVLFNPKDTNTFASASLDRTVKVWSIGQPTPNFTLEGHEKGVNAVDYFSGGELCCLGNRTGPNCSHDARCGFLKSAHKKLPCLGTVYQSHCTAPCDVVNA